MIFHYTKGGCLVEILETAVIRCSTLGVRKREQAVWFTVREDCEPTAIPARIKEGRIYTFEFSEADRLFGMARVRVAEETAPYGWTEYKRMSGMKPRVAKELYARATRDGSRPGGWRVSFEPVHEDKWLAVEVWGGDRWRPYEESDLERYRNLAADLEPLDSQGMDFRLA
ncbi:MAG: hypothetical protein RIC55_07930 [Pirellulaceae bacterium]